MIKFILFFLCSFHNYADTIERYMGIANNITRMEIKADPNAQAWARSARNVLLLTGESIWESLSIMNQISTEKGQPLFCIRSSETISAERMNDLIQESYGKLNMPDDQKNKMTVAQVALMGIQQHYPCQVEKINNGPIIQVHQKNPSLAQKVLRKTPFMNS